MHSDLLSADYIFLANCTPGWEYQIIDEIADFDNIDEVRGTYEVYDIFVGGHKEDALEHIMTYNFGVPGIAPLRL